MIELRADLSALMKGFSDVQRRQIPFATSLMLTAVAGHVGIAWKEEIEREFDRPTPFTLNSVAVRPARKSNLVATVYVKDIAAEYLEPYVEGGAHFLGEKKGLLTPKGVTTNAYGNLTKNKLKTLKGKSDVFVGRVNVRGGGTVSGVWQRKRPANRKPVSKEVKGRAALKLLIRFSDPLPVQQHLDIYDIAPGIVAKRAPEEFAKALNRAMASAR